MPRCSDSFIIILHSSSFNLKIINKQLSYWSVPFIFLVLISIACGRVGDPQPPLIRIPMPIADLVAQQQGRQVIFRWTLPRLNTDGSTAKDISAIEIFRVIRRKSAHPTTAESLTDWDLWQLLQSEQLNVLRGLDEVVLIDSLEGLEDAQILGREISYAIKVFNSKKQSAGSSNIASVPILSVPQPPRNLNFSLDEHFIEVHWVPARTNIDGSPVSTGVKFNVYRNLRPGVNGITPINSLPVSRMRFRDESAMLGKKIFYRVRAVLESEVGLVESGDSEENSVINWDTYPPSPPLQLTIVKDRESLSLVWLPNSEVDLAGYHVYRKKQEESFQKVTSELISRVSYIDRNIEKYYHYYYRVTAVDHLGNESGYSKVVSNGLE